MIENYNVTAASTLFQQQISLSSRLIAQGGFWNFQHEVYANGAATCTVDGCNVEIADLVGKENILLLGAS